MILHLLYSMGNVLNLIYFHDGKWNLPSVNVTDNKVFWVQKTGTLLNLKFVVFWFRWTLRRDTPDRWALIQKGRNKRLTIHYKYKNPNLLYQTDILVTTIRIKENICMALICKKKEILVGTLLCGCTASICSNGTGLETENKQHHNNYDLSFSFKNFKLISEEREGEA